LAVTRSASLSARLDKTKRDYHGGNAARLHEVQKLEKRRSRGREQTMT
jgi:hypothetical protein